MYKTTFPPAHLFACTILNEIVPMRNNKMKILSYHCDQNVLF